MADNSDGSIWINVDLDDRDAEKKLRSLADKIRKLEDDTRIKTNQRDRLSARLEEVEAAYKQAINAGDDESAKRLTKEYDSVSKKISTINEKLQVNEDKMELLVERAEEYKEQLNGANAPGLLQRLARWNWSQPEAGEAPEEPVSRASLALGERTKNLMTQWKRVNTYLSNAAGRLRVFSALTSRLGSIMSRVGKLAASAFIFTQITRGFSSLRSTMEDMLQTNTNLMMAMTRFKGAVRAMIEPIYSAVVPALTALLNLLTRVMTTLGTFTATVFGKTATEAQANAQALDEQADATEATGKAAKDASKPLASFDEINKLDTSKDSGGGGSGAAAALAGTAATGGMIGGWGEMLSGFLDKLIAKLPQLDNALQRAAESFNSFARKAAEALTFPGLADQVAVLGMGIADTLNHMIATIDWGALGTALGAGLNLALVGLVSFIYGFDWIALGAAVAESLNKAIDQIDWQNVGRLLWAKFKISIEFWAGLLQSLDMAALAKAASDIAIGFVDGISETLEKIDWEQLGRQTATLIANIKWGEVTAALFRALGTALAGLALFLWGLIEDAWNDVVDWWHDVAYEDGQFTIEGLLDGIKSVFRDIYNWLKTYVADPFVNGFKKLFGINSPSTVMHEQGVFLMEGLLGGISETWESVKKFFDEAFRNLKQWCSDTWDSVKQTASEKWDGIKETLSEKWTSIKETLSDTWDKVKQNTSETWDNVKTTTSDKWKTIHQNLSQTWATIKQTGAETWNNIRKTISDSWDKVKKASGEKWDSIKQSLSDTWDETSEKASEAFGAIKESISEAWSGMWDGVKGTLNSMLSGVESWINGIIRGINRLLDAVSDVAWAIGDLLGFSIPSLSISQVRLPRLAQGAVIPPNREFLAVLGDQKQGTNIEAPLDTIVQAFRQAMGELGGGRFGQRELVLKIGEREAGRIVVDLFNQETSRVGVTL